MQNEDSAKGQAEPALTVTATVTVFPDDSQGASVHIKVDCEGAKGLVAIMRQQNGDLQAAGRILQGVVMRSLSMTFDGPPVDLTRVGRA